MSRRTVYKFKKVYVFFVLGNKNQKYLEILAPKEHLRLTGLCSYVRTCVTLENIFTPYLVVELSPSAEIRCVYVTSIKDGTQTLTFLGIGELTTIAIFRILDFSVGI